MNRKIVKMLKEKSGIMLDLGCGGNKQSGFVGMDIRQMPGVDIVHDVERVPYPLPDCCCSKILLSHLIEHICPKKVFGLMNELWRITKPEGILMISTPYGGSRGFWQDPTHCHGWVENTAIYFDPKPIMLGDQFNILYNIYKPKPWKILQNNWFATGNMEIVLQRREEETNEKA